VCEITSGNQYQSDIILITKGKQYLKSKLGNQDVDNSTPALEDTMNPTGSNNTSTERQAVKINGYVFFILGLASIGLGVYLFIQNAERDASVGFFLGLSLFVIGSLILSGLFVVQPNEARVLTLFGRYAGSVRSDGLWWVNPFTSKKKISLRVRNFQSEKMKVNDFNGNPIEIAAVIVWRVVDSAKALFLRDHSSRNRDPQHFHQIPLRNARWRLSPQPAQPSR
jgi:hypothetical protein